ncbi:MAG TPA: PAS domain-containing protein [Burkholderiales bacterium]|jgi:PAS domain S-box-containing protein|nr:PAS domain-containing protein [Burkholderiales bacterium]
MTKRDRIDWLLTAINAVEDLVQPKLEARRKQRGDGAPDGEQDQELQICVEELRVAAEELTSLRDRLSIERQRYAELFDFAPEAYLETDARWNIREANRAAVELFGCPQEYLVGKPLVVFVAEEERKAFRASLAALEQKAANSPMDWGATLQSRAGDTLPVLIRAAAARDANGRVTGARCLIRPSVPQDGASPLSADASRESG